MPARLWLSVLLGAMCAVLAGSLRVHAQEPVAVDDQRARVHFEAGQSYFAEQRYDEAGREFGEAFALSGRPEMLLNQARALEKGGHVEETISALELLLERFPRTSYRPEVESSLARLRSRLPAPEGEPSLALPAVPPASAPLPAPAERKSKKIWPPSTLTLALGSTAVASAIVSLATGLRAHTLHGELDEACDATCPPAKADDISRGERLSHASTALSFGALALASAAAVSWFFDVKKARGVPEVDASVSAQALSAHLRWEL